MVGIIIAAGLGRRLGSITAECPKCLIPFNQSGQNMLMQTITNMRKFGCDEILVITGHARNIFNTEKLPHFVKLIYNEDYKSNNILHSLMCAKAYFNQDVVISYSDIWVESGIYDALKASDSSASIVVDKNWVSYYKDRTEHPIEQAEKVIYRLNGGKYFAVSLGKILPQLNPVQNIGEFIGLMRLNQNAAIAFRQDFLNLDTTLTKNSPFQNAKTWYQAYLTDFIQHQINSGRDYEVCLIDKGWAEFDTVEDYRKLPVTAVKQGLQSLIEPSPVKLK